jgi:hypothetical protein
MSFKSEAQLNKAISNLKAKLGLKENATVSSCSLQSNSMQSQEESVQEKV